LLCRDRPILILSRFANDLNAGQLIVNSSLA
jgi:hypothetical protein